MSEDLAKRRFFILQALRFFGAGMAFFGAAITTTASTLLIYMSTNTVGPFRTALAMNLEPLLTLVFSMILLGEVLTTVQLLGAATMIGALCAFQFVRGR